jgi:hypothetical protein
MNYKEYQEAFNVIKEFYDHAWNSLVILASIVTALGQVPNVIASINHNKLEKKMEKTLKDFEKELNEHNERFKNIENEYTKKITTLEQHNNEAMGGVLFMQGNIQLRDEDYGPTPAFFSFLRALYYFILANNERNIEKSIDMLMDISNATNISLEPLAENSETANDILKWMNDDVRKYRYADDIFFLKNIFHLA